MESKTEIKNRIDFLGQEIQRGWLIYGKFMDANATNHPEAIEVREILRQFTEERSKLLLMYGDGEATNFINKHRGTNATDGQQVLPLP